MAAVAALYITLWYLLPMLNRHGMWIGPTGGPEGRLARAARHHAEATGIADPDPREHPDTADPERQE